MEEIEGEFVGNATQNDSVFSGHLLEHKIVVPESVEFMMDGNCVVRDDGDGTLVGSVVSSINNTIDYETQSYNFALQTSIIHGEHRLMVNYNVYENDGVHQEINSMGDIESEEVPYELADENILDRMIRQELTPAHARRMLEERVIGDNSNVEDKLSSLADNFSTNGS